MNLEKDTPPRIVTHPQNHKISEGDKPLNSFSDAHLMTDSVLPQAKRAFRILIVFLATGF